MYDMNQEQAALLKAGDYVRYVPIDERAFHSIEQLGPKFLPTVHHIKVGELRGSK